MTHKCHPVFDIEVTDLQVKELIKDWNETSALCLEKFCWENFAIQSRCEKIRSLYLNFTRILRGVNDTPVDLDTDLAAFEFLDLETLVDIYCRQNNVRRFGVRDLPLLPVPYTLATQSTRIGKSKTLNFQNLQ